MMKVISKNLFQSIQEFSFIDNKILGHGSFGVVKLGVHKITSHPYAVKIISLKDLPSEMEGKLVERQINLHLMLDHPHIIKLWDVILEDSVLYMILEYAQEGNLFYHQNKRTTFTEPEAFRFFTQVVTAVQTMHSKDIMHRDLKPQNFLLDHNYNIKICDFGWSAQNIEVKRTTFCGTYEYMAPQMIFNESYDYRIDIWGLGVFLYELLHGVAPFRGQSAEQVKSNMQKGSYVIDSKLSQPARNLISNILQLNPNQRITIKQILNDQWVKTMQTIINKYIIKNSQSINPKNIHFKISLIPNDILMKQITNQTKNIQSQEDLLMNIHKKTISSQYKNSKNININFSINNFSLSRKPNHQKIPYEIKKKQSNKRCQTQADDSVKQYLSNSPRNHDICIQDLVQKKQLLIKKGKGKIKINKTNLNYRKSQQEKLQKSPIRYNTEINELSALNKKDLQKMKKLGFGVAADKMISSTKNIAKGKQRYRVSKPHQFP